MKPEKLRVVAEILILAVAALVSVSQLQGAGTTQCTRAAFPKLIGGNQSQTDITQIDFKNDSLAVCGITNDIEISNQTGQTPFIALYSGDPMMDLKWMKQIKTPTEHFFEGISFSDYGTFVIGCLSDPNKGNPILVFLNKDNGTQPNQKNFQIENLKSKYDKQSKGIWFKRVNSIFTSYLGTQSLDNQGFYLTKITNDQSQSWTIKSSFDDKASKFLALAYMDVTSSNIYILHSQSQNTTISNINTITGGEKWSYTLTNQSESSMFGYMMINSTNEILSFVGKDKTIFFYVKLNLNDGTPINFDILQEEGVQNSGSRKIQAIYIENNEKLRILSSDGYQSIISVVYFKYFRSNHYSVLPKSSGLSVFPGAFDSNQNSTKFYYFNNAQNLTTTYQSTDLTCCHQQLGIIFSTGPNDGCYTSQSSIPVNGTLKVPPLTYQFRRLRSSNFITVSSLIRRDTLSIAFVDSNTNFLVQDLECNQKPYNISGDYDQEISYDLVSSSNVQPVKFKFDKSQQCTTSEVLTSTIPNNFTTGLPDSTYVQLSFPAQNNTCEIQYQIYDIQIKDAQQNVTDQYYQGLNLVCNKTDYKFKTAPPRIKFTYNNNASIDLPPIEPFGGSPNVLLYGTFFDNLTYDLAQNKINIYGGSQDNVGTQMITIYLSNKIKANQYSFQVDIYNTAPYFSKEKPQDQRVALNTPIIYQLPEMKDNENNMIYVNVTHLNSTSEQFITHDRIDNKLIINATEFSQLGLYQLKIALNDSQPAISNYFIQVLIFNSPPQYVESLKYLYAHLNKVYNYTLPRIIDREGHNVTVYQSVTPKRNCITFAGQDQINVYATQREEIGQYTIQLVLDDGNMFKRYSFKLFIINDPPYFEQPLEDKKIILGSNIEYQFPKILDIEGLIPQMTVLYQGYSKLPSFVSLSGASINFNPRKFKDIGLYKIDIILKDELSVPRMYQLSVEVKELKKQSNPFQYAKISGEVPTASLKIISVSKDAQMKVKVVSKEDVSGIIKNITADKLQLRIITQGNEKVDFKMDSVDADLGQFVLNLQFKNPENVSVSQVNIIHVINIQRTLTLQCLTIQMKSFIKWEKTGQLLTLIKLRLLQFLLKWQKVGPKYQLIQIQAFQLLKQPKQQRQHRCFSSQEESLLMSFCNVIFLSY